MAAFRYVPGRGGFVGTHKVGRNDACPCGSGKKYKKCCLAADEARGAVARYDEAPPPVARLHPVEHGDPHVCPECGGDHLTRHDLPSRAEARAAETDEVLIERVHALCGARVDRAAFAHWSAGSRSVVAVLDWWIAGMSYTFEDQYELNEIATELWSRWLPDRPCIERITQWLDDGYTDEEVDEVGACENWLRAWDAVRAGLGPEVHTFDALADELPEGIDVADWIADLCDAADIIAFDEVELATRAATAAEEVLRRFIGAPPDELATIEASLGRLLFSLGRPADGDARLRAAIARDLTSARAYAMLTDAWANEDNPQRDVPRAIAILEEALGRRLVDAEDFDLEGQLAMLREEVASLPPKV